jgi:hypothetical protein
MTILGEDIGTEAVCAQVIVVGQASSRSAIWAGLSVLYTGRLQENAFLAVQPSSSVRATETSACWHRCFHGHRLPAATIFLLVPLRQSAGNHRLHFRRVLGQQKMVSAISMYICSGSNSWRRCWGRWGCASANS